MFPVNFDKNRTEHFLGCLAAGSPLGSVRTIDEMLSLAGACFFALLTHGPVLRKTAAQAQGYELSESQTQEHAEADDEMVLADLHAAVEFVGQLTMLVHDQRYDEHFEGTMKCLVTQDGGKGRVVPVEGFKSNG